jgi:hypothetical protein
MTQSQRSTNADRGKKEKFEAAGRRPVKKLAVLGVVVVALVATGLVLYTQLGKPQQAGASVASANSASPAVTYPSGRLDMAALSSATVSGDNVAVSLSEVTGKTIGGFQYARTAPMPSGYSQDGNNVALLAYVAPSGRLVVATSMCEPCRSTTFHIEGNQLVCNTCGTRWDLNTLKGVSGGCTSYPPQLLTTTVQGDSVLISRSALESWAPRV